MARKKDNDKDKNPTTTTIHSTKQINSYYSPKTSSSELKRRSYANEPISSNVEIDQHTSGTIEEDFIIKEPVLSQQNISEMLEGLYKKIKFDFESNMQDLNKEVSQLTATLST
ncbi:Hypothetical predicted protein [Pelobates cultripes]|uniref:Uncharacterized protein n=1 Tax=Pelobates cultripes TaxID=61616 RepID=A0AAD1WBI0_PELCU|nr:Hypothetical predicted protein [Pelobates cultripes]